METPAWALSQSASLIITDRPAILTRTNLTLNQAKFSHTSHDETKKRECFSCRAKRCGQNHRSQTACPALSKKLLRQRHSHL